MIIRRPMIRILDTVHCKANKEARKLIRPALAYKTVSWKRGAFGRRTEKTVRQHLITGRKGTTGLFLTGLLPRVRKHCKKRGHEIKFIGREENIDFIRHPKLAGIIFRDDQLKALSAASETPRGRILFPTGSGKTLVALGIISMFDKINTLFLCHTTDLLNQSADEAKKFFNNVIVVGGGKKPKWEEIEKKKGVIVIATIQSFVKYPALCYGEFFDMLIVDESHHAVSKKSQYGRVIQSLLAPRRYGFTATLPTKDVQSLTNEGFFGEVIAQLTEEEGQSAGIIAKININLVPVPYNVNLNQKCKGNYRNYYKYGIVQNRQRNILIVKEVKQSLESGEQILIIIEAVEHGKILKKMIERRLQIHCDFVHGSTDRQKRTEVKKLMKSGKLRLAIASRVWKEGINIPSLNHIINGCGMKEEKAVIQALGRGLRTTKDKDKVKLTDFADPYKYLAEHSILRLHTYIKKGWL